ncbi:AAWKG family protein [Streptomyces sp. 3N207]|uniref:AAWKG family protein n=1 Tax=Streptomyces sp. 3N207 TaxID=3457417 RepID=UPI003FD03D04
MESLSDGRAPYDKDPWRDAVSQLTGYPAPTVDEVFDSLVTDDGIPLMKIYIEKQEDVVGVDPDDLQWRVNNAGWGIEDMDFVIPFYMREPDPEAPESEQGNTVVYYKARFTLFGDKRTDGPPTGGWLRGGEGSDEGKTWDTTALTQYAYGTGLALSELLNKPLGTQDFVWNGLSVQPESSVGLGSFESVASAFDRVRTFVDERKQVLDGWEKTLGGEESDQWKGQAAGVFWDLIHLLNRRYERLLEDMTAPGNDFESKQGVAIREAAQALYTEVRNLYDAWASWEIAMGNPLRWLSDLLSEIVDHVWDNNISQILYHFDTGTGIASDEYGHTEGENVEFYTVTSAFRSDAVDHSGTRYGEGELNEMSTWKAVGLEAQQRWWDSVQEHLGKPAEQALKNIESAWAPYGFHLGAIRPPVGDTMSDSFAVDKAWQDEKEADKEQAEAEAEQARQEKEYEQEQAEAEAEQARQEREYEQEQAEAEAEQARQEKEYEQEQAAAKAEQARQEREYEQEQAAAKAEQEAEEKEAEKEQAAAEAEREAELKEQEKQQEQYQQEQQALAAQQMAQQRAMQEREKKEQEKEEREYEAEQEALQREQEKEQREQEKEQEALQREQEKEQEEYQQQQLAYQEEQQAEQEALQREQEKEQEELEREQEQKEEEYRQQQLAYQEEQQQQAEDYLNQSGSLNGSDLPQPSPETITGPVNGDDSLTNPGGSESYVDSHGRIVTEYPDGSTTTIDPDTQSATVTDPDGTQTSGPLNAGDVLTNPDGSVSHLDSEGQVVTDFPDGSTSTIDPDTGATSMTSPDGTTTTGYLNDGGSASGGSQDPGTSGGSDNSGSAYGNPEEELYDAKPYEGPQDASSPTSSQSGAMSGSSGTGSPGGMPLNPGAMPGRGGGGGGGDGPSERVRNVIDNGEVVSNRRPRASSGRAAGRYDDREAMINTSGGTPFSPPTGGAGGQGGRPQTESGDREREAWVPEEEDVWGSDEGGTPAVIGR